MNPHAKLLGVMRPIGGGDPIPLQKVELVVGRRPTCDVRLDFENISGKHCQLRHVSGVWHIRDLNSTNGTTVNGHKISSEHGLMPDDELGVAGHYYQIDYDPIAPTSLLDANQILGEEIREDSTVPRQRSLLELAGLESADDDRAARYPSPRPSPTGGARAKEIDSMPRPQVIEDEDRSKPKAKTKAKPQEPVKAQESAPGDPPIPSSDSGFFNLIRDELGQ